MKKPKNLLDERQQQELAQISGRKSSLVFWITAVSLVIKCYALDLSAGYYMTEIIILLAAGGMEIAWSVRAGIYDPYFKPTAGVTAAVSGVSALAVGGAKFIGLWVRRPDLHGNWFWTIGMSAVILAVVVFTLCYFALAVYAAVVKRSQLRQEAEWEEDSEG